MKKILISLCAIGILVTGVVTFYACQKDVEKNNEILPQKMMALSQTEKDEIDKLSLEIVEFHDYVIRKFLAEMYKPGDVFDNEYYLKLSEFIKQSAKGYSFSYLKREELEKVTFSYDEIQNMMQAGKNLDFTMFACEELKADVKTINAKCQRIEAIFSTLLKKANEFEEFEDFKMEYLSLVNEELASIDNIETYTPVRFFADMYIGSFETWASYLYGDNQKAKSNFWPKVKAFFAGVWEAAKPTAAVDAGGAVTGAMVGACAGAPAAGVGAAPGAAGGAAIGALSTSTGYCVVQVLSSLQ